MRRRQKGLMNRQQLGADEGMIFLWDAPVNGGFWMKDTQIPLSIAFVASDGKIVNIQDMEPSDCYTPQLLEANQAVHRQPS